ncbi:MAG: thiamine pyrophosphate-binding protein [Deltaproteobacteria bacterium]|nr:MAG: thiamine pyrophosphate-binding protein [Deltaproteobacteria bacterium]
MAETNVADTLVGYLSSKNVRHIFGVLAHTSFAIGDAIAKRPHMSFINAQHEGGAGNMALGYARATKQPAVCLVSAGGGATNIVTAVAQAHKESVPLFVISSDIDTAASAKGAYSSFHGMEHVRLFQPITKQSAKLERVEELGSLLDTLFRQTMRGRQGPVFLIVPEDLQHENLPEPLSFTPTAEPVAPAMDAGAAQAAVDLLLQAKTPVVLAGTGVDWAGAHEEVRELAELLSLPVAVSYTAKGVFPENHPLALGCLGFGSRPYSRKFFQESDLILALGATFSEGTTMRFGHEIIPEKAKIIQIDTDPEELGSNYPTALSIQADAKIALRAIIDRVKSRQLKANGARAQAIQQAKQAWKKNLDEKTVKSGLTYESVMKALNELLTGKEILTTSGMTGDTLRGIDAVTPIIHAGEFRAIGTALATAMGVKLGRPDARVICVTGDGSFMMEQQELATATYHKIPIFVLILRNNAYGGMKRDQIKSYEGRVIGTELFVPDLPKLAELYGAKGFSVTRKEELRPVFQQALASDDFVVVDVKLD